MGKSLLSPETISLFMALLVNQFNGLYFKHASCIYMVCMNRINYMPDYFHSILNMLSLVLLFAFFLSSLLDVSVQSHVIELSDKNFNEEINKHDFILVEFFAPWCGHCKTLAPHYSKAAEELQSNTPPIPLASVDCIEEGKDTCEVQGIRGFPALKLYRNGDVSCK